MPAVVATAAVTGLRMPAAAAGVMSAPDRAISHSSVRSSSRFAAARALRQNSHVRIAANTAAGWHHGRHGGHWRHRNGGFGWVGPLFWPYAYDDFFDYILWGDDYDDAFWGYGYGGIYAGMFSPYGYRDLARYQPRDTGSTPNAPIDQLAQMCGEDSRDIAGLPIDQFQQAIQPNDAQRAALDDLANASVKAAQDIKAACPTDIALTAPARLANMQQRIEAMIAAVATVQPPLKKFYDLLSDEQKARLTALGRDRRQSPNAEKTSLIQSCGVAQAGVPDWPAAEIDRTLHPTEAQRARLTALQTATAKAEDMLKASCQADNALTPPARLRRSANGSTPCCKRSRRCAPRSMISTDR